MKKIVCLIMALAILTPGILWAENELPQEGELAFVSQEKMLTTPHPEAAKPGCSCPCCQKGECVCCKKWSKGPGMFPMMGKPSMEMAQDGSVVVLIGNKLLKYDSSLMLVKEVEIPMSEMTAKQCPIMGGMSTQAEKEKAKAEATQEAEPAAEETMPDEDLIAQPI